MSVPANKPKKPGRITQADIRHEIFIKGILEGLTQEEAYRRAYPKALSKDGRRATSARLLADPRFQEHLKRRVSLISENWILDRIGELAEVSNREADKIRALELLAKWKGIFSDSATITNIVGQFSTDSIRQRLAEKLKERNKADITHTHNDVNPLASAS